MVTSNRPLKVFLCYAHIDLNEVKKLHDRLANDGVDVWMDKEKLFGGSNWEYEIRKAVRDTDIFITCVSAQFTKRSSQKYFSRTEVGIALDEAALKSKSEIFIIPVRLENCNVPKSLKAWHWVDLFEEQGYQKLILSLNKRIEQLDKDESSENPQISIVISGNVQGNVIVGDNNIAQFALENQQELSKEKSAKEELIENIIPEHKEEKQNVLTEELDKEKIHNVEDKDKVNSFWAYSVAIFISLLSSISISLSIFLSYYINSTTTVISVFMSIIISLFVFGIWSIVAHRYMVFLLPYTISFLLVAIFHEMIYDVFSSTSPQFEEVFIFILASEPFAFLTVFFLFRINNAPNFIYKVLITFFSCLILFLTTLLLETIFSINLPINITYLLPYLVLYFLICSYLGNWSRTIVKNRFPIFFESLQENPHAP